MLYDSKNSTNSYFPPLLGNGDIVLHPDCEGSVYYDKSDFPNLIVPTCRIFRAGRRGLRTHGQFSPAALLFFGGIKFDCGYKPKNFTQEMNEKDGIVNSECNYTSGFSIKTECFVHNNSNIYGIRKTFNGNCKNFRYDFMFDDSFLKETTKIVFSKKENSVLIDIDIRAYDTYSARVVLMTDKSAEITVNNNSASFTFDACDGEQICFYYILEDSLFCNNYKEILSEIVAMIEKNGFDSLISENKSIWNSYHNNGYIKTENELINSIYSTALYHLKCYSTKWSIPVGLNDSSWNGRYFAFDEYYAFLGLLQSNKDEIAKKIPEFRLNSCLQRAISRATDYSNNPDVDQARFMWETDENGEELAPLGFWMDHIFHMAVVAQGAFEYYEYTNDLEFLKTCYPMIKACAKFYTLNSIYETDTGDMIIGKCTDLERLGASVLNPFFTSCGAIRSLEILAKSADILNIDTEYRNECLYKAQKLRLTLPNDNEKYIPFTGCTQKSIAVFSGKYPFDVIDNEDPKLIPALMDFIKSENKYGNMYPNGNKVSIWYSAWKAITFARLKMPDLAYSSLMQATTSVGHFSECFEINEPDLIMRPWFSTAAGTFLSAVNEMLLQSDEENIYILPAAPNEFSTISFKLAAKGGAIVEVEIINNEIKKLDITFKSTSYQKDFNIFFRGKKIHKTNEPTSKIISLYV